MEQVRPANAQAHAQQKAQPAGGAANGKPSAAEAPASSAKDGFSLLLAALGGGISPADEEQGDGLPEPVVGQPDTDLVAADTSLHGRGAQETLEQLLDPALRSQQRGKVVDPGQTTPVQPDNLPAQVSLAEHLQMLLNQAQHALAGKGAGPDSMVAETARNDGAAQPLAGTARLSRDAAGGLSRLPGQGLGAVSTAAGAADIAIDKGGSASTDAMALTGDGMSAISVIGKESLQTPGSGHASGDPRVVLHEGGALGQWAGDAMAHKGASAMPTSADTAMAARSTRALSEGNAQAGTQGGSGEGAGLQQAPVQQGGPAADGAALAGQDGQLPGSFLEELGEQVAFWVHQKNQRAEFTLDQAGQPVQVQVTLAGDAAKVTFLSDHANVRQALDAGIEDLRSMLQEQGLALADVNVGVAGGRGEGAAGDGENQRQGGRRGEAHVSVQNAPAGAAQRSAGLRALDVFV